MTANAQTPPPRTPPTLTKAPVMTPTAARTATAAMRATVQPGAGAPARPAVRAFGPAATPAKSERVMVALVFGQSNAANYGETRWLAGPRVAVLSGGRFRRAADPLPGANGYGGSVWTRMADKLIAAGAFDRVILVPVAVGGTEIGEWTPDVNKYFPHIEKAIYETHAAGLRFTHLLWHQGESDAYLRIDPTSYRVRFMSIISRIRELGVAAPVFVAVATRCGVNGENADIRWVQRDIVNHDLRIWQGPDTDTLGPEYRHDGCHFSTRGLEAHAQMWVTYVRRYEERVGE